MKIKKVIYRPLVAKYLNGLPTFWIIKETSYFGFNLFFEVIGRDKSGAEPFLNVEEMEEKIKGLKL